MNTIGRKIYFDVNDGSIIISISERQGVVYKTTLDQDIKNYSALSIRKPGSFGVIELAFGEFRSDFSSAVGYRVNPYTRKLEFVYGDNIPSEPPVYHPPISEKMVELEASWMYDSMMKDLAIEESNATQADLMYQLMLKGVI